MIRAYVGRLGEGKTLSMVNDAIEYLKKGRTVYTNVPFHLPLSKNPKDLNYQPIYLNTKDLEVAIKTQRGALFCVDEASIVFPSYFWNKLSPDYLIRFAQARKYGMDIFYTSQGFSHTVKRLRDLTNEVVKCKKLSFFGLPVFSNIVYEPEFFDIKILFDSKLEQKYIIRRKTILPIKAKQLFGMFDTLHTITTSSTMGVDLGGEGTNSVSTLGSDYGFPSGD
jgi:zona occludens toxin (predicted ATPase)